jgi:hypothetical protein
MSRKHSLHPVRRVMAATLILAASSAAFADDNSMSVLTGDSYAYFNDLEYSAGRFNVARAAQAQQHEPVARMPHREPARTETPIMLAAPRTDSTLLSPFRDNTGA